MSITISIILTILIIQAFIAGYVCEESGPVFSLLMFFLGIPVLIFCYAYDLVRILYKYLEVDFIFKYIILNRVLDQGHRERIFKYKPNTRTLKGKIQTWIIKKLKQRHNENN